jgi:hypothetical protein
VQRDAVAHLQAVMGLSERRACNIVGADRKMIRYRSCRPPDIELRTRWDCQDFRVRAAILDPMEVPDGTTQSPPHP